jgi:hypothetical protein
VFRDRLINEGDCEYFNNLMREMIKKHLGLDFEVEAFKDLIYGDYLTREDKVLERTPVLSIPLSPTFHLIFQI